MERTNLDLLPTVALDRRHGKICQRGSWFKAEVRIVEFDNGLAVIKQWCPGSVLLRPIARFMFRREERIHRSLAGITGVPRLLALGEMSVVLEYVPGVHIGHFVGHQRGREVAEGLERIVRQLHRAGVYHLDLRGRRNILVDSDGRVSVIDFGAAVLLRNLKLLAIPLRPFLYLVDRSAVLKWKLALNAAALTPGEQRLLWFIEAVRPWRRFSWLARRRS